MPVSERLIEQVASLLSVFEAKTIKELWLAMAPPKVTQAAVRLAVKSLVERGRAKRLGRAYQHFKVRAVPEITAAQYRAEMRSEWPEPCHGPEDTTCPVCGLGRSRDGVALTTIEHPDGLIDKFADAIRSGKLGLRSR